MVSSQLARGEKESMVIRALCETLSKTGSSSEIVATTMMSALKRVLSELVWWCMNKKAASDRPYCLAVSGSSRQPARAALHFCHAFFPYHNYVRWTLWLRAFPLRTFIFTVRLQSFWNFQLMFKYDLMTSLHNNSIKMCGLSWLSHIGDDYLSR